MGFGLGGGWGGGGFGGQGGGGEFEAEAGFHSVGEVAALDGDVAGVFFYQLAGDPEAYAGAGVGFGAEEGVEDAGLVGFCDATAVVFYVEDDGLVAEEGLDAEAAGGGCVSGSEAHADAAEGVDGVGDEVSEDLAELVLEDVDAEVGGVVALYGKVE